jgi:outer membrane protein assembly factor BamD (BamD/ComL family)
MKKFITLILVAGLAIMFFSCSQSTSKTPDLSTQIKELEKTLYSEDSNFNPDDAARLMVLYARYADSLPDDPISPEYLFKAADISMYRSDAMNTISLLDLFLQRYSAHERAAMSLFLKAFVFDTQLGDTASARQYYEEFISLYPNEEFVEDAKIAIKNLGKSPEELINEFEKLNEGLQ